MRMLPGLLLRRPRGSLRGLVAAIAHLLFVCGFTVVRIGAAAGLLALCLLLLLKLGPLAQDRALLRWDLAGVGLTDDITAAVNLAVLVFDDDFELAYLVFELVHPAVQTGDLLALDGDDLLGVLELGGVGLGGLLAFLAAEEEHRSHESAREDEVDDDAEDFHKGCFHWCVTWCLGCVYRWHPAGL